MREKHPDDWLADRLEAVAKGEVEALHAIYEATRVRLFVICLGVVKNREAAEDVLQEVYLKVWNRAAGFDRTRGTPWPWLGMIARNTAIDRARARRRRADLDGEKYLIAREDDVPPAIDDQIVEAQEGERVLREVDELDAHSAHVLRAAFVEGLSYSEVAAREGLPLGTVKSRIRRALKVLRERLEDG